MLTRKITVLGSFLGSDDDIEDFESQKHNLTVNGTSGSGNSTSNQRGSGIYTGSGSGGTIVPLPLCRDCFGHGTNPTGDPRCRIGCRGSGAGTGAGSPVYTQQNSNAFGFDRKAPQVGHVGDDTSKTKVDERTKSSKKNKKLKFAFVMLSIVGIAFVVATVIIRRKFGCRMRPGRVVSWNDTSLHPSRDNEDI